MSEKKKKRRIYIVGGKAKNVPPWLDAAFEWEQFDQENAKTRTLEPTKDPDAVVCLKSWVGHEHWYGARDLAERLKIPLINSPGGWSSSLKAAADLGVEWFIQDIERARADGDLSEEQSDELEEFIDNAWREAYEREYEARAALEKRYGQDRKKFEHAQRELKRFSDRDEAAQRVISEIRKAAAAQRASLEEARAESERRAAEIQARSERVAAALSGHMLSLLELFEAADLTHEELRSSANKLNEVRGLAKEKLATLQASLEVAEGGIPERMKLKEPVSASNPESDS